MLTCRHTTRLLSDRLERSLSWFERLCLQMHLLGCRPCRCFGQAIGWLHGALAFAPSNVQLPTEARERIQLALEQAERES
jgi:predicted anti-sigma-YlaC factor YlaD